MVRAERTACSGDAGLDRTHRQVAADHAGRTHHHLVGVEVKAVGGQLRHLQRVFETLRAGARVGVARRDDQGLHAVMLKVQLVDDYRGGLDLVGREDSAGVAWITRIDHAEVVALPGRDRARAGREGFDAARGRAGPESLGERQGHWIGASRAVLRSNPNAMLKHSTPCPDAPLTRLSSAAVTTALSFCADTLTRQRLEWLTSLVVGLCGITRVKGWPA